MRAIPVDLTPDPLWPDVVPAFAPGEAWDGVTKTRPEAESSPLLIEHGQAPPGGWR